MSAEARLKELGIVLPKVPDPVANYLPYRIAPSGREMAKVTEVPCTTLPYWSFTTTLGGVATAFPATPVVLANVAKVGRRRP